MVQTQLIIEIHPVAVHLVVDVLVVQLQGATGAVLWWWTSLCSRSDKFQQLSVPDGPQTRSSTFLSSASEGYFAMFWQHFSVCVQLVVEEQVEGRRRV